MSEAQLLLITDYYLDSVFHPMLYMDERTFQRESWRYELENADAPLNVNGTVYNEMRGAMNIERSAVFNMLNTLYPGTPPANDSGGIPKYILTMTYEECVDFHRAYYHPSNALIFLYGDLNIGPFLELIDSYCDTFDRKDIHVEKGEVIPFSKPTAAVFEYPVEISSKAEDNSIIHYAFNIGRLSPLDYASFEILSTALGKDASPVVRKLREVLPNAKTEVYFYPTTVGCYLTISAMGINESDGDTLKDAVDEAIAEIMKTGFDKEFLEAAIASEEFHVMSMPENSGLGLRITSVMAWLGSFGMGYNSWNEWLDAIEIAKAKYTFGYFEAMVREYIVDNPHNVLVTTVPVPGLKEKLDEQLRAELDIIKSGMSGEEIAKIMEVKEALTAMSESEVPTELINRLTAVTVETLPIETKAYDIRQMSLDGVKAYVTEAATGGLNITNVGYNSAAVTLEELHYLSFYADMLGEVPTKNLDLTALKTRMARYLYKFSVTADSREFYDYAYKPMISVQWYSINSDYAKAAALVSEILTNTDLSDVHTISGVIGRLRTETRKSINSRPDNLMYTRARASRFGSFAYYDYTRGIAYHQFLSEVQKLLENDPESFIAKLRTVRDKLKIKDGVVVMFAGNDQGIGTFEENANTLLSHLTDEPASAADLNHIPRPADTEGVVIEASVQYNVAFAAHDEIGLYFSGKLLPLAEILNATYLLPVVRDTNGAYGCWALANRHGVAFISFRDPSVAETFAAYEGIADFAAGHSLTQDDIDRYIISIFSQQTAPEGELYGALKAMLRKYQGYPDDYKLNILKEIKTATPRDLTDFSKYLSLIMAKGTRSTAGGQAAILDNADLYESIIYPFGAPRSE